HGRAADRAGDADPPRPPARARRGVRRAPARGGRGDPRQDRHDRVRELHTGGHAQPARPRAPAGPGVPRPGGRRPRRTGGARPRQAGAVILGKTGTTEFASFTPAATRNPHDLARTPGGSSSGSAAAVADGMAPLALGSQTVGSTIRPAAFCGVAGLKPTHGALPLDGVLRQSDRLCVVGMMAADVAGVAALWEALS